MTDDHAIDEFIDKIRALNDNFRRTFTGGVIETTERFDALPAELKSDILWRIRNFEDFAQTHDTRGNPIDIERYEHSLVTFEYRGYHISATIDHMSVEDETVYSHDPFDPTVTQLVMKIDAVPL